MAFFVKIGVVMDRHLTTPSRRDAGYNPHIHEGFAEPIRVVTPICQQSLRLRQAPDQSSRAGVIARLTAAQEHADGTAERIRDSVQFGVQAAFRASDEPPAPPFFSPRLEAVRWALRCVASIISVPVSLL